MCSKRLPAHSNPVKSEFETFHDVLTMTQKHLNQANADLDKLVGVRTRQIQRTLKDIQSDPGTRLSELEETN